MKKLFLVFLFCLFSINLFAITTVDSLNIKKIEKLVQKEEEVALAFKNYLVKNGKAPKKDNKLSIEELKKDGFLPEGFDTINPFGAVIEFENSKYIKKFDTNNHNLKLALKEYYLKSKNRKYTKALSDKIEIVFSHKENFILKNPTLITKTKTNEKFLLDDKGVLNYYTKEGKLGYSYDKEIVLDPDIKIYVDGIYQNNWHEDLNFTSDILRIGTSIFDSNNENSTEHIVIGPGKIVEINKDEKEYGKTIIQFNRRSGGMIVNGDLYTWGNNGNALVGINAKANLTSTSGTTTTNYQLFTSIVPFRTKIYDTRTYEAVTNNDTNKAKCLSPIGTGFVPCKLSTTDCNNPTGNGNILCMDTLADKYYSQNYLNSPKRAKFVDFFSSVYVGTCAVDIKGALYCSGQTANNSSAFKMYSDLNKDTTNDKEELLYISNRFDGNEFKAKKIFANNSIWHILGQDGYVYTWGTDGSAFGGQGSANRDSLNYTKVKTGSGSNSFLSNIVDITYITTIDHRRIGALDSSGNIYIWGSEGTDCDNNKFCYATKVTSSNSNVTYFGENKTFPSFISFKGGRDGFIAKDVNNNFYRVRQKAKSNAEIEDIRTLIENKAGYDEESDKEIISADLSKAIGDTDYYGTGIAWINSKGELKGDIYVDNSQKNDALFNDAIKKIKWTQIKVIDENNGMCGIDINNQMYCWGEQAYYRTDGGDATNKLANTYMIPIFNTNLFDLKKDFMVGEASSNGITKIGYENWQPAASSSKSFNMKYPTYIGGFNYEFEFK